MDSINEGGHYFAVAVNRQEKVEYQRDRRY